MRLNEIILDEPLSLSSLKDAATNLDFLKTLDRSVTQEKDRQINE